jgi:hypothetical protein
MQVKQTEEQSLQVIVGAQLSAVTFVQDYVQLHFDGPRLTAFSHPVVRLGRLFIGMSPAFVMHSAAESPENHQRTSRIS